MNPWERQDALARTTVGWSVVSLAAGAALAARRDPWWRAFGQQHVGWGLVDLGIVAVARRLQTRRMARLDDPYGEAEQQHEGRQLRRVLGINVAADAGYVVLGAVLWRRRSSSPRASGAGAAIVVQGLFLFLHDGHHALGR